MKKIILERMTITDYAAEGKCIARHQDKIIFVEGVVPGDVADLQLLKNKKDWAEARAIRFHSYSSQRVQPFCEHFSVCGGCKWQMLPYSLQTTYKEQQVRDQLQRIGKISVGTFFPILGCEQQTHYRNKLEFTFSNRRYLTAAELNTDVGSEQHVLGFHAPGLFDKVIDIQTCYLQAEPTNAIRNWIRNYALQEGLSFYDIRQHQGLLRNLIIRRSKGGQVLVNLVAGEADTGKLYPLLDALIAQFPDLHSLHYTINLKWNDSLYDQEVITYHGADYLEEYLGPFRFKISPKSFFQTNTGQTEKLYELIREFAGATGTETLYDLYCGTGTIGIFLSPHVHRLIGVETVEDAVADAQINAAWNGVSNSQFFCGDVIRVCQPSFFEQQGKPDLVILDPPRAGCHEDLLNKLLELKVPRIVYVSCNPATQARDLSVLQREYQVDLSRAVDMFPHTHHVENVVQLNLRQRV